MSNLPKVSIIIPVCNGENYLAEAIESALAQSYDNLEVIVINDGSKDNTEKIALSYGKKIKYFHKSNGGVSSALNLGIEKMTGDYFSWLSHDDLYYENKISESIDYILKNDLKETILFSDFELVNMEGKHIRFQRFNSKEIKSFPIFSILKTYINGITLLIPKEVFKKAGNFDEKLKYTQDYDMWWRAYQSGFNFEHIGKILTKTRIHENQDTNKFNEQVARDGNAFWLKVLKTITAKEQRLLSGSELRYYKEIDKVFRDSVYNEVKKYIKERIKENKQNSNLAIDKYAFIRLPWLFVRDIKYKGLRSALGSVYRQDLWRNR